MRIPNQTAGTGRNISATSYRGILPAQSFPSFPPNPFDIVDPCTAYADAIGVDPNTLCTGPVAGGSSSIPGSSPGSSGGSNTGSLDCALCSAQHLSCFANCTSLGPLAAVCVAARCIPQLRNCVQRNQCN